MGADTYEVPLNYLININYITYLFVFSYNLLPVFIYTSSENIEKKG